MKDETSARVKLGLFVTMGLALFIIGIYYIGDQRNLFSTTFSLKGTFNNVSGLQVGNNVRFSGINVGTVENIKITSDTSVVVTLIIEETVRKFIKKDAKAVIGSEGLMGNKVVNIISGSLSNEIMKNNDIIQTTKAIDTDEILNNLQVTSKNVAIITDDLSTISSNIRQGKGTIGMLLMDTTLSKNIDQTIVNAKEGVKGFSQNMDAAKHNFFLRGFFKKKEKKEAQKRK